MAHYSIAPGLQFKLNDFSSTKNIGLPKQPGKMAFELYTQPFIKSIEIKSRILIQINAGMEEDSLPLTVQNIRYIFLKGLIIKLEQLFNPQSGYRISEENDRDTIQEFQNFKFLRNS